MSHSISRRDFLTLMAGAGATVLMPRSVFAVSGQLAANISINVRSRYVKINPNVMGVGLQKPPFTGVETIIKDWFSRRSVRLWTHPEENSWEQQISVLRELKPSKMLTFQALVAKTPLFYRGMNENNLASAQKVDAVVAHIRSLYGALKKFNVLPPEGLFWETCNEPAYKNGGKWKPEELAHYVNDLAISIKRKGLPVKILAPLNQNFDRRSIDWNERLCSNLDATFVDGLVSHYYSNQWSRLSIPVGEFERRAGYADIMRARVRQDLSYASRFGKGRWGLHCSEWNIHPHGIHSRDVYISKDMAAALFIFDTVKIFLEEGLQSAQFFQLLSHYPSQHFAALAHTQSGENIIFTTGALWELFHKYLDGDLFETTVEVSSYKRASDYSLLPDFNVPYIAAMGSVNDDGHVSLFLSNKHSEQDCQVAIWGIKIPSRARGALLTGCGQRMDIAHIKEVGPIRSDSFMLPKRSILVLAWNT